MLAEKPLAGVHATVCLGKEAPPPPTDPSEDEYYSEVHKKVISTIRPSNEDGQGLVEAAPVDPWNAWRALVGRVSSVGKLTLTGSVKTMALPILQRQWVLYQLSNVYT